MRECTFDFTKQNREIMKDLGIQYDSLSIHTLNDSWGIWGCDINEDFELHSFLSILLLR